MAYENVWFEEGEEKTVIVDGYEKKLMWQHMIVIQGILCLGNMLIKMHPSIKDLRL